MLKQIRRSLVQHLWEVYRDTTPQMRQIEDGLKKINIHQVTLDHFAIIDLPGPHSGINHLCQLFSALGFITQGSGYLPEKQNDFLWMTEVDSLNQPAKEILPQVVVADFRAEELPSNIRIIIEKYARLMPASPLPLIRNLAGPAYLGDAQAAATLTKLMTSYFAGRDWPLPTVNEFRAVHEFNELLAWVLVFGRKPNHFTVSVHLLPSFDKLENFNDYVENELKLTLNHEGGAIKGDKRSGIAQASTLGMSEKIQLADGMVSIPTGFVEFVWRFSRQDDQPAALWQDYFTGFVAKHADYVIESLYTKA